MVNRGSQIVQFYLQWVAFVILMQVILISAPAVSGAQTAPLTPAILMGVVTSGPNSPAVVGAKVIVNGSFTYTTSGGIYSMPVDPAGTFTVTCLKPGFDAYTSAPVVFVQGVTTQMNITLWETLTPPSPVTALLDTIPQSVAVSWASPAGSYELLYDDGIQDNFTIWAFQGNMNAVKFTPAGFPVKITGGSVNIGSAANYPSGGTLPGPFQVSIYDATGAGGTPGSNLAGPFTVVPQATGWVEFTLPLPVVVSSGSFYIVMIQVGTPSVASGIAIDETLPQFRSYSRFVTGGSAWFPAGGNFMIRALCDGPGGPFALSDASSVPGVYNIFRLRQGEEQNPLVWTSIAATSSNTIPDNSWSSLPCGPYRWGVKAQYPGNRWSPVTFSNILGKCWTAPVTIHLNPSCLTAKFSGTFVHFVNLAYPDTNYAAISDTTGLVAFPHVWKGTYQMTASKFGYDTLVQAVPVISAVNLNVNLLQVKIPPANLVVKDSSLQAHWDVPHFEKPLFTENWSSGSFTHNGWTIQGGVNWLISSSVGHPAPCALFASLPHVVNYAQSLVSKTISGERSTLLKMKYDILLDNAGTTTVNQMAVELWNGNSWNTLKNYTNSGGNFAWTTDETDISAYTAQDFRIRFRAYGGDSFDINSWCIDNVSIIASEPAQQQVNCILGYYFYLGNVISGYTTKNAYQIPGSQVQYGQTYNACVRALYGSGYSDFACTSFTSEFLYPVRNLHGSPVENAAFIAWDKPNAGNDTVAVIPPGLIGYSVYRDDSLIAQISDPDTLSLYDLNLESGIYKYGVAAQYNLNSYGFPGQVAESTQAGPISVTISFGRQLPFFESWDHGSFSYNDWRFTPSQGNWVIDFNEGIPQPAASFKWQPPQVSYNYTLESPPLNGVPFSCAAIWLDFDLKLTDRNATGTEKMVVEAYYNHEWHQKAEIKNSGSLSWTSYHLDISPVRGKGFRVRFRAAGENSSEILNWFLDNISVYPVCYPATSLAATPLPGAVKLSWAPPACYGGNLLHEGFEESYFPPSQWTKQNTSLADTWSHLPATSPLGAHNGNFSAGLNWDYSHQDEWLIAHDIYVNGDLTFWSYAFQGSLHLDHYYVQVSLDQGATWNVLLDMSALPPYPGTAGVNAWNTPYHIDLSAYAGETVDIAWHAVDGDGNGLWYPWAIDDCSIGADDHYAHFPVPGTGAITARKKDAPLQNLLGYDIYRQVSAAGNFTRINQSVVTDTTYTDAGLQTGQYHYFVQSRFLECVNSTNSDTVQADVITGLNSAVWQEVKIFPNPASNYLTVTSPAEIEEIRIFSSEGICEGRWPAINSRTFTIDTKGIAGGIYILQLQIREETRNYKVCLTN
ncbi:MAG: choice-of-anchor J domain-containing protein [Bacteroidota bacterium]